MIEVGWCDACKKAKVNIIKVGVYQSCVDCIREMRDNYASFTDMWKNIHELDDLLSTPTHKEGEE